MRAVQISPWKVTLPIGGEYSALNGAEQNAKKHDPAFSLATHLLHNKLAPRTPSRTNFLAAWQNVLISLGKQQFNEWVFRATVKAARDHLHTTILHDILPIEQRTVFALCELQGLTEEESAILLNLSVSEVHEKLRAAKQAVRRSTQHDLFKGHPELRAHVS